MQLTRLSQPMRSFFDDYFLIYYFEFNMLLYYNLLHSWVINKLQLNYQIKNYNCNSPGYHTQQIFWFTLNSTCYYIKNFLCGSWLFCNILYIIMQLCDKWWPGLHHLPIYWLICLVCLISTLLSSPISTLCRDNSTLHLQGCLHPTLLCK